MSILKSLYLTVLTLLCITAISAEEVVLIYADQIEEVTIFDSAGKEVFADFGTILYGGYLISLGATNAELQYAENGSILKLREYSTLKFDAFQDFQAPKSANKLSLVQGKMRTIAARLTNSRYSVLTPSTALGIRGTDFIVEVNSDFETSGNGNSGSSAGSNPDILIVLSGRVEALDFQTDRSFLIDGGKQIFIGRGSEGIVDIGADLIERLKDDFSFVRLDPDAVPFSEGYQSDFDLRELWENEEEEIQALSDTGSGRSSSAIESKGDTPKDRSNDQSSEQTSEMSSSSDSGERDAPSGREGETREDEYNRVPSSSSRLLLTLEPGYTVFTSSGIKEISDGGFGVLAGLAGRIEGDFQIDLGFRVGAIFCAPKLDAIESYTMVPITFFAGLRSPLTPLFYFGGEAGLGFELLIIKYAGTTGFPDDKGFTPLVDARLLAGLDLGFLQLELKVGLSGFFDNGFQSAIPISLGVSMGMDL